MLKFYAHSLQNHSKDEWQELEAHLKNVSEIARRFAQVFNAGDWGYAAGILHDIGKYSIEFQEMLSRVANEDTNGEQQYGPDHSSAGAREAVKRLPEGVGRMIGYCIAGHHSGLLDPGLSINEGFKRRLTKDIRDYSAVPYKILALPNIIVPPLNFNKEKNDIAFQIQFFVRMIFSCLIDADFLDTEAFMDKKKTLLRRNAIKLKDLRDKVIAEVERISRNDTAVNRARRAVFEKCVEAARNEPGVFSLTVPTGGGKTLSSLAFALDHAIRHGMQRVIYVIPYTSIIEQNAEVFKKVCGDDAVLEHHCNFDFTQDSYKAQLAAENWDVPLIVTTNVQFFETLFHNRVSKCRKAHNILNSVVIFDEVQMLPVELLKPCMAVMKTLARDYRATLLLCSATQPALARSDEFTCGIDGIHEIMPDPEGLYQALRRTKVEKLPILTDDDIVKRINDERQVLCVVNTRKHARQLYEAMPDKTGTYHLSALMCPAHRSEVIARIKDALKAGERCRLISTQLIEAGVDIDFPIVYRAQAGIDSIAQSAGRCNREGRLAAAGKVFVFQTEKLSPPGFLRQSAETAEGIMRRHEDVLSLEAVNEYFEELYWRNGDRLDKKNILERLAESLNTYDFPFRTIGDEFRWIENDMRTIIVPYNATANKLIAVLKVSDSRDIGRRLQRYAVQVYPDMIAKLDRVALEPLHEHYYLLTNDHLYKKDIGLDSENPYFRNIEENIC